MRNKGCPVLKWDNEKAEYNIEEILAWEKAEVEWSDTFTGPKGTVQRPEMAHWTLFDSSGFIGFDCIRTQDQEHKARAASAMFLYLYHHTELDVGLCESLAQSWALRHIHNEKDMEEIDKRIAERKREKEAKKILDAINEAQKQQIAALDEQIAQAERQKKEIAFGKESRFCKE